MSHDFHAYGLDGIALNRVAERHAAERRRNEMAIALKRGQGRGPVRFALGALLMRVGGALAGTTMVVPMPPAVGADSIV
jgi:hypothetical protein